jgi:hypothetical protein
MEPPAEARRKWRLNLRKATMTAIATTVASLFLTMSATAASATVPPESGGAPPPIWQPYDQLLKATATGSTGYVYIYTHNGEPTGYDAELFSCDTAGDGHHSWAEIEEKVPGGSWSTVKLNSVGEYSDEDLAGLGTCSGGIISNHYTSPLVQLRVATYTAEGGTVVHGPGYSSVFEPY